MPTHTLFHTHFARSSMLAVSGATDQRRSDPERPLDYSNSSLRDVMRDLRCHLFVYMYVCVYVCMYGLQLKQSARRDEGLEV